MSRYYSLLLTIFFLQITYLYSTPINSVTNNHLFEENFDFQHTQNTLQYLIKNILHESNLNEQMILLNQLREYLNRMCTIGYFGSTHAHACQRIVDVVHQLNKTDDENNLPVVHDETNNDQHGLQKRFFCNGFIGCKSGGR